MNLRGEQYKSELTQNRQVRSYYASIRRPWIERITFTLALLTSIALSLRVFGIRLPHEDYGQWLTGTRWLFLLLFVGLDSIIAKTHHPVPIVFGDLNPIRIFEKFSIQGRLWQLALVLMLPIVANFSVAIIWFNATR